MEINSFDQFNIEEKTFLEVGAIFQGFIEMSDVCVLLVRNNPSGGHDLILDPVSSIQLGFAMFMDKPIFMLIPPGTKVPDKVASVVDRFIEFNGLDEIHLPKIRQKLNESWDDFKNERESR